MSRKLASTLTAIAAITTLVLTLAAIHPSAATLELSITAVVAISGLGGYHITRQATIDREHAP